MPMWQTPPKLSKNTDCRKPSTSDIDIGSPRYIFCVVFHESCWPDAQKARSNSSLYPALLQLGQGGKPGEHHSISSFDHEGYIMLFLVMPPTSEIDGTLHSTYVCCSDVPRFGVMRQDKAEKVVRDAAAAGANIILLQVRPFQAPSPPSC